jgi:hypothetical protein
MTLLDGLKPQYKDLIDQKNDKFPTLIGIIYDHLESEQYIFNLKWGVWSDIKSFTNVDNPYDLFINNM